ncbi:MAG: Rnase Y domain-containing protein, partial [Gemmatimonadota bacterium]|nr:Rnase Y domain-containing protein [Gemmatimonadota bacterium]
MASVPAFLWLATVFGVAVLAGAVFFLVGRRRERRRADVEGRSGAQQAERHLADARRSAEQDRAQAVLAAKEEIIKARELWETEAQTRREEVERHERRLEERTATLDRKLDHLEERDRGLEERDRALAEREQTLHAGEEELRRLRAERQAKLEALAGMT